MEREGISGQASANGRDAPAGGGESGPSARGARVAYRVAAALLAVYVINVLIGKAAAIAGVTIEWRLGDVGEFLVVLAMAVAFVTGLIINEGAPRAPQEE